MMLTWQLKKTPTINHLKKPFWQLLSPQTVYLKSDGHRQWHWQAASQAQTYPGKRLLTSVTNRCPSPLSVAPSSSWALRETSLNRISKQTRKNDSSNGGGRYSQHL